ncbi:hypothetical protein NEMIN01_2289 [Nematocida minor]|uniref:uncharacterized protein n=1 Tax=Nematocida minor TaxID=1912983 RepID=UPI00221FF9E3|nr:uncharacterized protein NEMIN01_2289 [Nematocida minor]KAI5192919.1 hypothetical protein NEMIN01_2289 [Nematocida minor]
MARREVKLKVNIEELLNAFQTIDRKYVSKIGDVCNDDLIEIFLNGLKDIFRKHLQIESEHSEKENSVILEAIINNMNHYFIYNEHGRIIIFTLHDALRDRDSKRIRSMVIRLANELIKPNSLIYRPEHGINMQFDKNKSLENIDPNDENADLSARTYTLEIDSMGFSSMESFLQASAERLDAHNFRFISESGDVRDINNLKMGSLALKRYNLYELYTKKYENTGMLLIDYGMKLIYEKQKEIEELIDLINEINYTSNNEIKDTLMEEIPKLFSRKELGIICSIRDNAPSITTEKILQTRILNLVEYMIKNNIFLEEKNEEKVLKIGTNLNGFYENYINTSERFVKMAEDNRNRLNDEIKVYSQILKDKEALYFQLGEEETEEKERVKCSINNLENEIYLLKCDSEKEYITKSVCIDRLKKNRRTLEFLSVEQEEYISRKIKEFANAQKIKIGEPEGLINRKKDIVKTMIVGAAFLGGATIAAYNQLSKEGEIPDSSARNVLNSDKTSSHHEQQ